MQAHAAARFVPFARIPVLSSAIALLVVGLALCCCSSDARFVPAESASASAASNATPAPTASRSAKQPPQATESISAASAQASDAPRDAVERLPSYLVISPWGRSGTALRVSDELFLTARHVLPRRGDSIELGREGKRFTFERVLQGEEDGPLGDWTLFRVSDAAAKLGPLEQPPVLSSRGVRSDRDVFLAGFWQGPGRWTRMSRMRSVPLTIIQGPAMDMADSERFPRRHLVFVESSAETEAHRAEVFSGMSGGPAAVWDSSAGRATVVGVYVGGGEYERAYSQPGTNANGRAQIVRRIPQEVIDAVNAERAPNR